MAHNPPTPLSLILPAFSLSARMRCLLVVCTLLLLLAGATTPALQTILATWLSHAPFRADLAAHFGAHAVFAALLPFHPLVAASASFSLALLVETLQATPLAIGRAPALDDIVAGACGSVFGAYGSALTTAILRVGGQSRLVRVEQEESNLIGDGAV